MRWKDFFYFTRSERQGVFVLIVLIVAVWIGLYFIPPRKATLVKDETFEKEYAEFKSSIQQQERKRKTAYAERFEKRTVVLQAFDPNTSDSVDFLNLGLPPWMAKNILRYRDKGGQFRKPEDFRKIYGLTEAQYTTLLPYISIKELPSRQDTIRLYTQSPPKDTLLYYKYPVGTTISLNRADTTELQRIPGIGSGIARMIVGYRKQLGGFYEVDQLKEIRLAADKLHPWFTVDTNEIRQMNLNKASVETLKRHPYFNFYQAQLIVEHRKKKGRLTSLRQLRFYDEFTANDLEKITPYVCFD